MNDLRLKQWAASIGTHISEVIERFFKSVTSKDQADNSALSAFSVSKTYSNQRLEIANKIALLLTRLPRYKHQKEFLYLIKISFNQNNEIR